MNKFKILVALLALVVVSHTNANAAILTNSYFATDVWGNQAPPPYALRLDGFFDGNSDHEATFGFNNVLFNQYDDGSATLIGQVTVVEFDNGGGPPFVGLSYNMIVNFDEVTLLSDIAKIDDFHASYTYYNISPAGIELVSTTDPDGDYAHLWTFPPTDAALLKPFQVGYGANNKNGNFGAAGWLSYYHTFPPDGPFGREGVYNVSSDFLMDLTPVPEPATLALFGIGMAGAAIRRKFKKN